MVWGVRRGAGSRARRRPFLPLRVHGGVRGRQTGRRIRWEALL